MVAFRDGSSNLSTKKAGSGAYILGPELENGLRETHELAMPSEMGGTNNAAELEAVGLALSAARDIYDGNHSIVLLTDSAYV